MLWSGLTERNTRVKEQAQDFPLVIATMPATDRQTKIAVGIVSVLTLAAAVMAPFASIQVGRIDAFIPVLQTVVSVADLITATLLFAQFSIQPQPALLALASAYIFSGSFAFLQTLAFPGGYAPAGLIGDGPNSPAWIYVLWHTTFTAAVLVYALSKDRIGAGKLPVRSTMAAIIVTVAGVLATIAVLTWIVTTKTEYIPSFFTDDIRVQTRFGNQVNLALWLWGATALAVLLSRRRTMLDLWVMVTLLAYMPNFLVAIIGSSIRFTIGWYAARCFVLVASCMLLSVLLVETMLLYSRLASAIMLQRRERTNRLLSVEAATAAIAHEIKQPLAAMSLNSDAALECLKATPVDLEDLRSCLMEVKNDNSRANEIVEGVRALFKTTAPQRTMIDVNLVAREVLKMVENELHVHGVSISTVFQEDLPQVRADQIQLQQVILNVVRNAIDAITAGPATIKAIRLTTAHAGKSVISIRIQDSGPGIAAENETQIFESFFSTKPSGMGLGLSISRRIIEDHGGKLRLTETSSKGCLFEITLPL
ncbi:MAG: two-component sensor histidine kinase [Verrucomicrobia bacterium]|nr:MAG: two-component sensor histidine kinase [Verrucomicrobiota bacterium]